MQKTTRNLFQIKLHKDHYLLKKIVNRIKYILIYVYQDLAQAHLSRKYQETSSLRYKTCLFLFKEVKNGIHL